MYNRWYDKYSDLKSLLELLETVDKQYIEIIAQDFLQIILEKYSSTFDEAIKKMSDDAPPRYSRWYDENYDLHTCIEFIKTLDDNKKRELINSFIMSLASFITNADNG